MYTAGEGMKFGDRGDPYPCNCGFPGPVGHRKGPLLAGKEAK